MTINDPTVTENAIMLTGYIAARLGFATGDGMYRVSGVVPDEATLTVEHVANGNTYAVQVRQIGGIR